MVTCPPGCKFKAILRFSKIIFLGETCDSQLKCSTCPDNVVSTDGKCPNSACSGIDLFSILCKMNF